MDPAEIGTILGSLLGGFGLIFGSYQARIAARATERKDADSKSAAAFETLEKHVARLTREIDETKAAHSREMSEMRERMAKLESAIDEKDQRHRSDRELWDKRAQELSERLVTASQSAAAAEALVKAQAATIEAQQAEIRYLSKKVEEKEGPHP